MKLKINVFLKTLFLMAFSVFAVSETFAQNAPGRSFVVYVVEYDVKIGKGDIRPDSVIFYGDDQLTPVKKLTAGGLLKTVDFSNAIDRYVKSGKATILNKPMIVTGEDKRGAFSVGNSIVAVVKGKSESDPPHLKEIIKGTTVLEATPRVISGQTPAENVYRVELLIESNEVNKKKLDADGIPLIKQKSVNTTIEIADGQTIILAADQISPKDKNIRFFAVRVEMIDYTAQATN
jgi:Bacterial type II and III secretion system protein